MTDETTTPKAAELLADPCTSYWLKAALKAARERDLVDALNDAELLVRVLDAELEAMAR